MFILILRNSFSFGRINQPSNPARTEIKLRPAAEFHPIWGAAAPTVGVIRMIVFAIGVGAAAGAATFSSLLDQHQAQPARSMAVPGAYPRAQSDPTTASSWPTATENSEPTNSLPLPAPNTSAETPPETSAANQESTAPAAKPDAQTLTKIFTRSLSGRPQRFALRAELSVVSLVGLYVPALFRTARYCTGK